MTDHFSFNDLKSQGIWVPGQQPPEGTDNALRRALHQVQYPVGIIDIDGRSAVARGGKFILDPDDVENTRSRNGYPVKAYLPPLPPEALGDEKFRTMLGLRYAYVAGAMANGIASVSMVEEMARAGMIGFFGAAGLTLDQIETAIITLQQHLGELLPFGMNLIHSPTDPELEMATVTLYLQRNIHRISAAAYMDLTLPLVLFRTKGIYRDASGKIICPHQVVAKVSRVEVAKKFLSPPPDKLLTQLLANRLLTGTEAELASKIPMADAITAEADSGGHTDNRPAISLLPTMLDLRDEFVDKYRYQASPHVGLAGGIATPNATAAAFAMGAAYVLTGSINQGCVEAGTSEAVKQMLAEADQADVIMAPAADMFELGVKVQVLKRGTLFPLRAAKLYDLYCTYESLDRIPVQQQQLLERDIFHCSLTEGWRQTCNYFEKRDPKQVERAETDAKYKMALLFRSYLGRASTWAVEGVPDRKIDYQIWCGPAMGAFNQWTRGSFLEKPDNRKVVTLAMNLMMGASVTTRVSWLRHQGVYVPACVARYIPTPISDIQTLLEKPL